jgi:7-cyano-7-deazaguanine synthase in queuosine biosynthesis
MNNVTISKRRNTIRAKIVYPEHKKTIYLFAHYNFNVRNTADFFCVLLCLPVFAAFSFIDRKYIFKNAKLTFFEQKHINNLLDYIKTLSRFLYIHPGLIQISTQKSKANSFQKMHQKKVGLFYGGGAESLLALSLLLKKHKKNSIILQSCVGHGWIGSDPQSNKFKEILDKKITSELGLQISNVKTNLWKEIGDSQKIFQNHLKKDIFVANAGVFNLILYTACAPALAKNGVTTVYHGLESENNLDDKLFCMSKNATKKLENASLANVKYKTMLMNKTKLQIYLELAKSYKNMLKYQYSCFSNQNQRWCEQCEKCFRYLLLCYLCNVSPKTVGLHQYKLLLRFVNPFSAAMHSLASGNYQKAVYSEFVQYARTQKRHMALNVMTLSKYALKLNKFMRHFKSLIAPL